MKRTENSAQIVNVSYSDIKIAAIALAFICASIYSSRTNATKINDHNRPVAIRKASFLPIELISFFAKQGDDKKVVLKWSTSREINSSHFVIQRSTNNRDFQDAALLFTQEGDRTIQTDYKFADQFGANDEGKVSYRLKMVESNGNFTYSGTVMVNQHNDNFIAYNNTNKK